MTQPIERNTSPSPLVGEGRGEGASLLKNAKSLRSNMTDAEKILWRELRAKRFASYKFRRQAPMQKYIADFVSYNPKLIIELDGGQHSMQQDYDAKRNAWLHGEGFDILRFWNNDVMQNTNAVLIAILDRLEQLERPPLPNPLPQGERELRGAA